MNKTILTQVAYNWKNKWAIIMQDCSMAVGSVPSLAQRKNAPNLSLGGCHGLNVCVPLKFMFKS